MVAVQHTGLLEQPVLVITPADAAGRRRLCDSARAVIGQAWWRPGPWWQRWLLPVLRVHEAPEQPLVFTVSRRVAPLGRWRISDADGDPVGALAGRWLLGRWDQPVAWDRPGPGPGCGTFVALDTGRHLGTWRHTAEGVRLEFPGGDDPDPFTKMLLLAAVLLGPNRSRARGAG